VAAAIEVFTDLGQAVQVSGGTDAPTSGSGETVTVSGCTLPAVSVSASPPTHCYVRDPAAYSELIEVTSCTGPGATSVTVTRGANGTVPVAHQPGWVMQQVTSAGFLNRLLAVVPLPSGDTTGTADQAAIQGALNNADIVIFPDPGSAQWYVTGNLEVPDYTKIIGPAWHAATPIIKLVNSSGASCVFGSKGYLTGATFSGNPIEIRDLSIDVNGAHNASCHGIVFMNYSSVIERNYILNPSLCGIVQSDANSSGTVIGNTAVENVIARNKINWSSPSGAVSTQYGIWVRDVASGANTDGYMYDNIVNGSGDFAIRNERAAGWFMAHNHVYACQQSGMYLGNLWNTFFHHNEAEQYGKAGAASTTYYGFDFESILPNNQPGTNGRPSEIDHNIASADESGAASSAVFHYFRLRNATTTGETTTVFDHNTAHQDKAGSATSVAWDLQQNSSTMSLIGGYNVADGPSNVPVTGSGTLLYNAN
jgi:hypothetical protein